MPIGLIAIAALAVIVLLIIVSNIHIVQQSRAYVIERLGAFSKVWQVGIHVKVPFIERVAKKVSLKEQVLDYPPQPVITKDNVTMQIDTVVYFQITDPKKAVYEIDNLPNAIEKLTQTSLRNVIGELELDETLTSRDTINTKLQAILDDATNKWGVKVNRVELQDITPPESVRVAMEKQMQAERNRRAEILNAEGEKQSLILRSEGEKASQINKAEARKQSEILRAEGDAQAIILNAQAEADAIRRVAEAVAVGKTDPAAYMLAMKYIDTLREMTTGKDNKTVYIPYEASSVLSSLGSIRTLFNDKA